MVETGASHLAATRAMIAEAVRRGIRSEQDLNEALTEILYPIVADGELFFGFRHAERWSLSVYLFSGGSGELVNVWREKARTHPGRARGRPLRPGEGHVGQAFLNRRPIIAVDAESEEVLPFIAMPPQKAMQYDADLYRSFASFPIGPLSSAGDPPFGVLVATSDDAGRFFSGNCRILDETAAVLAPLIEATRLDFDRLRASGNDTLSPHNPEGIDG